MSENIINHKKMTSFSTSNILLLFLILLLLSVESSLQTSIVWDRNTAWTLWLYKVGPFSIADIIILTITVFTLLRLLLNPIIPSSPYISLCLLALVYLCIGFIYNMGIFTLWKTYFYDIKVFLYLTIPYLFLNSVKNQTATLSLLTPKRIFIYTATAALIDFVIVNLFGQSEYPQFLGYPAIPALLPMSVIAVGIIYSRKKTYKLFFLAFLGFELINAVNRLSLGILFELATFPLYFFVLRLSLNLGLRFAAVGMAILAVNSIALLLISNPFNWTILAAKTEGALTRQIQMENAIENFKHNIPGVVGKGLGSTWFEYISIPETDIYSVGTSVGTTSDEAMSMPVKFIFNWVPPALLHKWGIIGTICLIFLLARYYHINSNKIRKLWQQRDKNRIQHLNAILVISFLFTVSSFTYIGNLKASLITSILAFYVEDQIRKELLVS